MHRTLTLALAFHWLSARVRAQDEAGAGHHLAPSNGTLALQKGMGTDEVDQLLGTPARRTSRKEGTLTVNVRTYDTQGGRVVAEFVEGVLSRYTITSR